MRDDRDGIAKLIASGADVNAVAPGDEEDFEANEKVSPLHVAALRDKVEAARILLKAGANVDARDFDDATPLMLAQSPAMVSVLSLSGADVNARSMRGTTALQRANSLAIAGLLLRYGARVDERDSEGVSALHEARTIAIARYLVSHGASISAADLHGHIPIATAINGGHNDIALFLLHSGSTVNSVDEFGDTPLHLAVKARSLELAAELLSKHAKVNSANKKGETPLLLAVQNVLQNDEDRKVSVDPLPLMAVLIKHGANVNVRTADRKTPLIEAALRGDEPEALAILLKNGAELETSDNLGYTALHWVAWNLQAKNVRYLIEHKANVNARDAKGETPLSMVEQEPKDVDPNLKNSVFELLRSNGARM